MNPNFDPYYRSVYDQYNHVVDDHEMLGYIDGLAMCADIIDESPRCYGKGNSVYDFGFDRAMNTIWFNR